MSRKRKAVKAYQAWAGETRTRAWTHARALAIAIVNGAAHGPAPYDLGIILEPGEHLWHRCPAQYSWRTTVAWTEQRVSCWGYRATARELAVPRMVGVGLTDWIITNHRLATRASDGQVISIHWTALTGLTIDLAGERITLDGPDGYHGELTGPATAPIAVAAVAACHGPSALLEHPAIEPLRGSAVHGQPACRLGVRGPAKLRSSASGATGMTV